MKRVLVIVAAVVLAGCSGTAEPEAPTSTYTPTSTPASTPSLTTPAPEPTTTEAPRPAEWPLTGQQQDGVEEVRHPVIGIKVENSGAARPWIGLQDADLVFVEMVEGGITRFHAVYNSTFPAVVGPVRSLRPMDAAILGQWDGTLLASGGQPQFIDRVESAVGLMTSDRGDAGLYRDQGRRAPHNVMADLETIVPLLSAPAEVIPLAAYHAPDASPDGGPATTVRVDYPGAKSTWTWEAGSSRYLRSDQGSDSVEVDGTRIAATNVVVLRVETRNTGALDPAGNPVPETILSGSGSLTLFQGGTTTEGTWTKGGDNDPFVLTDAAGEPLTLAPGNTWIELLPSRGSISWD